MFDESGQIYQGFSDAELQGIIDEIEGLEREFAKDDATAMVSEMTAQVLGHNTVKTQGVHLDMALNLGRETIHIKMKGSDNLCVSSQNFELTITETHCSARVEGGGEFSLPLTKSMRLG